MISIEKMIQNRVFRFIMICGLNTLFGYGLLVLLIFFGLSYPVSLLISTLCGILFNFKTIGYFVFENSGKILIFKFFCVYGIVYLFNFLSMIVFKSFGINVYLGSGILLVPSGFLSFFLNRNFVFNKK